MGSPVAVALGAKPLKPEKSVNLSFGATANPFRGFDLTADYYQIKIKDRIVLTENLTASRERWHSADQSGRSIAMLNSNGFQSVGAARFFINGIDTTTRGLTSSAPTGWQGGSSAPGS